MSSNDIVYTDDESVDFSDTDMMFKMNDINPEEVNEEIPIKKELNDMDRDELLEIIIKDKENKKRYIKKYQKTEKGKTKTRQASKKYYDANRAKILEKKRLAYQLKKQQLQHPIENN